MSNAIILSDFAVFLNVRMDKSVVRIGVNVDSSDAVMYARK